MTGYCAMCHGFDSCIEHLLFFVWFTNYFGCDAFVKATLWQNLKLKLSNFVFKAGVVETRICFQDPLKVSSTLRGSFCVFSMERNDKIKI